MSAEKTTGAASRPRVDRLIHEPARYNIMALLYVVAKAEFLFVQNHLGMTPGNLSAHAGKLEAAGYLRSYKKFVHRKPKTFLALTEKGRRAFEDYRSAMTELLNDPPVPGKGGSST